VHTSTKAHLTSRDPDLWPASPPNLIVRSQAHCQPSLKISCKSVQKSLRKAANRQTNRQTNNDEYISSLAEVTNQSQGFFLNPPNTCEGTLHPFASSSMLVTYCTSHTLMIMQRTTEAGKSPVTVQCCHDLHELSQSNTRKNQLTTSQCVKWSYFSASALSASMQWLSHVCGLLPASVASFHSCQPHWSQPYP